MTPVPLIRFAEILRTRNSEIITDWRSGAPLDLDGPTNGSARAARATRWLEELTALAEGRAATLHTGRSLPDDSLARRTIIHDLSLLHRVIRRRARVERATWGPEESELLWHSFENRLAGLIGRK